MSTLPFNPTDLKAVFFDLDGTLVNTDDVDVSRWARRIARAYGDTARSRAPARQLVMALESPVNALFAALDWLGLDTLVVRLLIELQGTGSPGDLPAMPGVDRMVRRLAGRYLLGVVSTRSVDEARLLIAAMGVEGMFEVFAGRDSTWRIKPHPQPVLYAARTLGIDPGQCLMVGDTAVDIRAGRRAGAWTCGVLCGYGERRELERAGAHIMLDNTAELDELLLGPRTGNPSPSESSAVAAKGGPQ